MGIPFKLKELVLFFSLPDELTIYRCLSFLSEADIYRSPFDSANFVLSPSALAMWESMIYFVFRVHLLTEPPHLSFHHPQLLKWTCRKLSPRPRRPVPRNVWSWVILTAAGCRQRWPNSRRPALPLCPPLVFNKAGRGGPSQMGVTPLAGQCPKMIWTKGATGPNSTTHLRDTAARKKMPSRSSL